MDVENANCKAKVSQCADMEILPIEKPLKVDVEIKGLQRLIEELHRVFSRDYVNVQEVQTLMCGYKSNPKDWAKFAKFDRFRYTRNLVDSGNGAFNIMIICWGPGHASSIHDHSDSHCFMKLLSGNLDEVRYEWPENVQPEVMKVLENNNAPKRKCCSKTQDDIANELSDLNVKCETDSCQNGNTKRRKCLSDICQNGDNNNGKCHSETCQNGDGVNGKCQSDICQNGDNNNGKCHSETCQNGDGVNGKCQSDNCQNCDENNKKVCDSDDEDLDFHDMKVRGRTKMKLNDVCYINDALGLHRVENPSHVDSAVSLHLYCPPFDSCRVFDARTGKPAKVKVTFWSMYGKKIRRVMEANS